jgi:uncharacterized protein (DUF1330 family)
VAIYFISDISVHDSVRFKKYADLVPELISKYGGTYVVRASEIDVREGSWNPERLVVVKFPSIGQAHAFLNDPDYQSLAAIRQESATSNTVLVEGC